MQFWSCVLSLQKASYILNILRLVSQYSFPGRIFHSFGALKPVDRHISCSSVTPIPGSRGCKIVKCLVVLGFLMIFIVFRQENTIGERENWPRLYGFERA